MERKTRLLSVRSWGTLMLQWRVFIASVWTIRGSWQSVSLSKSGCGRITGKA